MCTAGVHWSVSTARPTTNGERMIGGNNLRIGPALLAMLLMAGCAGLAGSPVPAPAPAERESSIAELLREREAQLTTLRKQLAAAQIASAKREAEVAALREQVAQLRREGIESRQLILELRQAAEASQAASDAPRPGQVGGVPTESDIKSSQSDLVNDWRPAIAALIQDVEQLKGEFAKAVVKPREEPQGASSDMPPPRELTAASHADNPLTDGSMAAFSVMGPAGSSGPSNSAPDRITVAPGDSLWSLARKHRTTVERLRRDNQLRTDRLEVGQRILLVTP